MEHRFGQFVLDLKRGELRGAEGPIPVEPRAFRLLSYLVEQQGRLLEREELITAVWDGRIVSDAAVSTAVKAVRRALGDDGSEPHWLKTVRGRGFRFDAEISTHTNGQEPPHDPAQEVVNGVSEASDGDAPPSISQSMDIFERPSVLVVSFESASDDGPDRGLALGLAQEVRLNLSHWRWFPVIGPEAVGYKTAGEINVRETARAFGATYALTGSVRSFGDRVRVNATLSATDEGRSIWSRHFDGSLENLFDFEEDVSRAIVAQIEPEISSAISERLLHVRPNDMSAWHLLLEASEVERRAGAGYGTPAANEEQIQLLTEALDKDPEMPRALAWLARCHWRNAMMGWTNDSAGAIRETLRASERAMEVDPAYWEARCFRAIALLFGRREFFQAEFHAREAVRLNPSDALARHALGCVLENVGRPEEALEHLESVFVLNPNHSNAAAVLGDIITCHMLLDHNAEAVDVAMRLITLAPNYSRGFQRAIAALSQAGEVERAKEAVARLKILQPDFNENYVRTTYPFQDDATMERFVKHLRNAGAFCRVDESIAVRPG